MNRAAPAVVVTFALPAESHAFTACLTGREVVRGPGHLRPVRGQIGGRAVLVVHTGVGDSAGCRERLEYALHCLGGHPGLLISSGYAGALQADLAVGDLVLGRNLSTGAVAAEATRLLEGWRVHAGDLTTQPRIAETPAAKAALGAATGALAVEMESGWIAEACARAGVPMLSLRVISDAAGQAFPAPGEVLFDAVHQRPRYVALPVWLLLHPGRIGAFGRFVRGLGPARKNLARALVHLVSRLGP